tara:strand:+ start:143 stop:994 length:852 start_codon:yes stop_codon:yes gene_type:complete
MIVFNSSLPRAGSTLLSNILGNNPDIYASPSSGLADAVHGAHFNWQIAEHTKTEGIEKRSESLKEFLRAGIKAYYNEITDKPYIIDKNRAWLRLADFTDALFPQCKMLCIVRHPFDIFASMEKLFRKNPMDNKASGIVDYDKLQGMTVESRVNIWMNNAPLGHAFRSLYNTIQTKLKDDIMYLSYEQLTDQPEEVMRDIYKYLDIPYYKQDYNNIKQVTHENDVITSLHIIRPKIEPVVQNPIEILGVDSCLYIQHNLSWFFDYFGYQKLEAGENPKETNEIQ